MWKVTGRYIVSNLCQIITRRPSNFDIYCTSRNIPKRWTDMFLLAWTLKGYQAFLQNIHHKLIFDAERSINPEQIFRDLLDRAVEDINIVRRFSVIPLIYGVRGLDSQNYSEGRDLWKFYLRSIACKLFPWLWI